MRVDPKKHSVWIKIDTKSHGIHGRQSVCDNMALFKQPTVPKQSTYVAYIKERCDGVSKSLWISI